MNVALIGPRKEFGKTVAADLTHRLKEDILTCELKPGDPLKFEELRARYGVSFSPLREALMALVADGLVISEQQRGFRVAPTTLEELTDLTDSRVFVELEALRKSIDSGHDHWEIGLVGALHQLTRAEERTEGNLALDPGWREAHRMFHHALVAGCGSPILLSIRSVLFDRSERFRSLSARHRQRPRDKIGEHRALMTAAIARDAQRACELLERHIRATADNIKNQPAMILSGDRQE